jgi:hypothetical protein
MPEIVNFDSFLGHAHGSDEPQRLLFIFVRVELPEDATEEERRRYEAGQGGGLVPVMYVDKAPEEVMDFSSLVEESQARGEEWHMVLAAALVGEGAPPAAAEVEETFNGIIQTVHTGGDLSSLLAFDREGDPVVFD